MTNLPVFYLVCTLFSFLCLYLDLSQAQFRGARRSAEPPPRVRRPSEAFRCIFTTQRWKRKLKQACEVLFTLQCLVFCSAKDLQMLPVTMDTCLHWSCWKRYRLILMVMTFPVELSYFLTCGGGKAHFNCVIMRCNFGLLVQKEIRLLPDSIVTFTDGHVGSKTPR